MIDVYALLFDRMIGGKYPADHRLKEESLAAEFGVSRTPVREALRQLAQDGLVQILPRRGARVVGFTVDDVEEIYDIRATLELLALRHALPRLGIQGLKALREALVEVSRSEDPEEHQRVDARLHDYFIEASPRRRLASILRQASRLIRRFRDLGFRDPAIRARALEAHLSLVDALSVRDLAAAEQVLSRHIEESKKNAISSIVRGDEA
jgi:DNA-binding GntR family transcriptional regulator